MASLKEDIIEEINELIGNCLSITSENALKKLSNHELLRIEAELRGMVEHAKDRD